MNQEGMRRGVGNAQQVVFLSDGAAWTEALQRQNFAGAVSILDFYHGAEWVHALAKAIDPDDGPAKKRASKWIKSLLKDKVSEVIEQARQLLPTNPEKQKAATEQINFLDTHQARIHYGTYRKKGWFVGSGVIEAGCKTVVGKRLKQSGMFWSQPGASSVLQFRTILLSGRFDAFWTDRQNKAAARKRRSGPGRLALANNSVVHPISKFQSPIQFLLDNPTIACQHFVRSLPCCREEEALVEAASVPTEWLRGQPDGGVVCAHTRSRCLSRSSAASGACFSWSSGPTFARPTSE